MTCHYLDRDLDAYVDRELGPDIDAAARTHLDGCADCLHRVSQRHALKRTLQALPYFPLTPTFPWLGPLGAIPLPSRWRIQFGTPIATAPYGPDAADDRGLVIELSERVRDEVQRMVYDNLVKRGSAFI